MEQCQNIQWTNDRDLLNGWKVGIRDSCFNRNASWQNIIEKRGLEIDIWEKEEASCSKRNDSFGVEWIELEY